MNHWFSTAALLTATISTTFAADLPKPIVTGLKSPESVCVGADGAMYITEIGEFGKDGDGQVTVARDGRTSVFAKGLDDPKGIVKVGPAFYVADKTRVIKIDSEGKVTDFAAADKFPTKPLFLNDIAIDPDEGTLFVSDSGNLMGEQGAVFSIEIKTGTVSLVVDSKSLPGLHTPNGLASDGKTHLMLVDFGSGTLYRIKLDDKSFTKVGEGFDGGDGLTWDKQGHLWVTSWKTGKVFVIPKLGEKTILVTDKFEQAADTCLDGSGKNLLVPDMKAGTLTALPAMLP